VPTTRDVELHGQPGADPVSELIDAAAGLGTGAHHLRAATGAQRRRLDRIADRLGGVLESADEVARGTASSALAAASSRDRAREGEDELRAMITELGEAAGSADQVAGLLEDLVARLADMTTIVAKIDGIASQTRLLALNAAIEAARAGDQGRGFAVVADEVRKLSDASAEAVTSVRSMIEGVREHATTSAASSEVMRRCAADGAARAEAAGAAFGAIRGEVEALSATIEQVAGASQEQAATARELAGEAGAVAAGADATAGAAAQLVARAASVEATATTLGAAVVADGGAPDAAAALAEVGAALAPVFDVPREHAGRFLALLQDRRAIAGGVAVADLAALDEAMQANLARFRREVCGATLTVVPRLLDDRELWMQWWAQSPSGPRQLTPQLDRTRPGFYDYTADEWFTVPARRRRTWLSDPYFDEGGADLEIVTISVPAVLDGTLVAVATADLDLAAVAQLCAPALRRLPRPAALLGEAGNVVATSDPARFPLGAPVPEAEAAAGVLHRSPALDWALLVAA
jgi:hypothetical protein